MLDCAQDVVPVAVPEPPAEFVQVTLETDAPDPAVAIPAKLASVAVLVRNVVAEVGTVIVTVGAGGGGGGGGWKKTVIWSVPVLEPTSVAVAVMTLLPGANATPPGTVHVPVPVAVPDPPAALLQVTDVRPTSSLAVPPSETMFWLVVNVVADVGDVIVTVGAAASYVTVIVSVAIWPAESWTVTVIGFEPASNTIPLTVQLVVPVAVPLAPVREFAQVTDVIVAPLPVSEVAVPLSAI